MGYKLGKMVKIFFSLLLFISFSAVTEDILISKNIEFSENKLSLDKEANIYTISAGKDGITLRDVKIDKPSSNSLKMFKLITPRDKFGLKKPFLGQVYPEFIATGWHFIFNSS